MPTISAQLNRIVDRSTKIIDLCVTLQEENDLLKLENQSLKVAMEASSQKVKEQEEKLKTLAVARSLEGITESAELLNEKNLGIKQNIDDRVRDVDKCMLLPTQEGGLPANRAQKMGEISIKINIADRIYPLRITTEEEEIVRRAAKLINDRMKEF